jgi:hypothetical protein
MRIWCIKILYCMNFTYCIYLIKFLLLIYRNIDRPEFYNRAFTIINSYFDCDLSALDFGTLVHGFQTFGNKTNRFIQCYVNKTGQRISKRLSAQLCGVELKEMCQKSKFRAIKTIRVPMRYVEAFLQRYPDLRVIHLVRDPRAQINSIGRYKDALFHFQCNLLFHLMFLFYSDKYSNLWHMLSNPGRNSERSLSDDTWRYTWLPFFKNIYIRKASERSPLLDTEHLAKGHYNITTYVNIWSSVVRVSCEQENLVQDFEGFL